MSLSRSIDALMLEAEHYRSQTEIYKQDVEQGEAT